MKKYYLIFSLFIIASTASFAFAQTQSFFDLLNLKNQNLGDITAYEKIHIIDAWDKIASSSPPLAPISIGIFDTGIDRTHPEFIGVSVDSSPAGDSLAGGHGTQVAGIIGANNVSFTAPYIPKQMNGILSGVKNLDYTLHVRQSAGFLATSTSQDNFNHFVVLDRLARNPGGVDLINGSFGAPLCSALTFAQIVIRIANDQGCFFLDEFLNYSDIYSDLVSQYPQTLFIFSAGNDNIDARFNLPGGGVVAPNVIAVGATDLNDGRADFPVLLPGSNSNFGLTVNISAPGEAVYAPKPGNLYDTNFNGTSASAPLVTGTAGILKSIKPSLTPAEIKQILVRSADPITTDQPIGGRLNAFRAVCDTDVLNCVPETEAVRQGFNQNTLPPNDDGSTGLIPLGFTANFYGTLRTSLYVNNNGNLTFNAPLSAYTPPPLNTLGRDIIAPFFADVDTRSGAVTSYGEGFVNGRRAFGITWPGVGCFNQNTSVKNIFQAVLSDRSDTGVGNFDVEFNYDMIEWESGQASGGDTACKGGIAARAGFASASGTAEDSFELPGSGIIGALLDLNAETGLIHGSRGSSQSGRYVFPFRGGRI